MKKSGKLWISADFLRRILWIFAGVFLFVGGTPVTVQAAVKLPNNPVVEDGANGAVTMWDCIYFGSYLQSEITYLQTTQDNYEVWQILSGNKKDPKEKIKWDANGDTVYKDVKYHRAYETVTITKWDGDKPNIVKEEVPHYYRLEPIKWRVLSVKGNDAFVVSDKALDCKPYHMTDGSVTWETCTLRSWLNGYGSGNNADKKDFSKENFLNTAFSKAEQSTIRTSLVSGETNPETGVSSGNASNDKIFLLSATDLANGAYGFETTSKDTVADTSDKEVAVSSRVCANTGWAAHLGAVNSGSIPANIRYSTGWYWLRLPGRDTNFSAFTSYTGNIDYAGALNSTSVFGVRPAMHINLETVSGKTLWKYAGTVNSLGQADEPENSGMENGTDGTGGGDSKNLPSAGIYIRDNKSGLAYRILTSTAKSKTVAFTGVTKQKKSLTIPASIKYSGYTYNVVSIDAKAMQKKSKLTSLTIGKNVKTIGRQAFYGCKKLKKITVKTSKLTIKDVKKNAFRGIHKKVKIKVPGKKVKAYKKLFRARGISGKAKFSG